MAFKHGKSAAVWYGSTDMSPYLFGADLSIGVETSDVTTFASAGWRNYIPGLIGGGYEFEGLYDPAETNIQAALGTGGGVLTVCPSGTAIGDLVRLVPVITTAYGQSSPIEGVIGFSWGVTAETAIASGRIIHALTEDTNTTTGTGIDQTASTSTGWTAHLHVTLVDGGSWVVTVQDSADNSSWATIATFAAKTAAGSERLVSAASTTTVRRYVRVVATRTGGSAGQGITYALGFARTNQ